MKKFLSYGLSVANYFQTTINFLIMSLIMYVMFNLCVGDIFAKIMPNQNQQASASNSTPESQLMNQNFKAMSNLLNAINQAP